MSSARLSRQHAAELAARHIREGGMDMASARSKAARQLGLSLREGNPALPSRRDIQSALASQLALFQTGDARQALADKRHAALQAMDFLQRFSPRLCGPVLEGSAQPGDPVMLHLHADTPEDVALFLHDQQLPARLGHAPLRLSNGVELLPHWQLVVDGTSFQLWVLPPHALRAPPLDGVDHRPLARASAAQLRALLQQQ